jgi:hypothetical protein
MVDAADSINPNVEMVSEDNVVSGSGGVTFDDLDKIQESSDKAEKITPKKEEDKSENEEEIEEETDEPKKEPKEEVKPKQASKDSIEAGPKGKKVTASLGGEDFVLNTGATVQVKIDGELKAVPIQALINDYSGKQAWDQRFSELDTDRQDFIGRVKHLDNFVQSIFDKSAAIGGSENKVAASFELMKMIGQLAGKDPRSLWEPIAQAIADDFEQTNGMSELEKENWGLKRKFELDTIDRDIDARVKTETSSKQETAEKETQVSQRYGLTPNRVTEIKKYLTDNKLRSDINDVVELDRIEMVHVAVSGFDKSLVSDKPLMDSLIDQGMKDPSFNSEDILTVLREVYPKEAEDKSAQNLKRKLGKTGQAKAKKSESPKVNTVRRSEDLWDALS